MNKDRIAENRELRKMAAQLGVVHEAESSADAFLNPLVPLGRLHEALCSGNLAVPSSLAEYTALYQRTADCTFTNVQLNRPLSVRDFEPEEDNVLVPVSGGLASAAAVWYALRQGWKVYLLHIDGFAPSDTAADVEPRQRQAVRELALQARDKNGLPLFELSESDSLASRLIVLPAVQQRDEPWPNFSMHPHDALQLYTLALRVMILKRCKRIVWGGFWGQEERQLVQAYSKHAKVLLDNKHECLFPFQERGAALYALIEAHERSEIAYDSEEGEQYWRTGGEALMRKPLRWLHSCDTVNQEDFERRRRELPNPLGAVCGNCAHCKPWLDLCAQCNINNCENSVICFTAQLPPEVAPRTTQDAELSTGSASGQKPKAKTSGNAKSATAKSATAKGANAKGANAKGAKAKGANAKGAKAKGAKAKAAKGNSTEADSESTDSKASKRRAVAKAKKAKRPKFATVGDADMDEFFEDFLE